MGRPETFHPRLNIQATDKGVKTAYRKAASSVPMTPTGHREL